MNPENFWIDLMISTYAHKQDDILIQLYEKPKVNTDVVKRLKDLKAEIDLALQKKQPRKFKRLTNEYIYLKAEYGV